GGPMAWSAATGIMVQSSNVHSPPPHGTSKLGTYAYWKAGSGWTDYTSTVTIKSTDNDAIGVMFRYQDENNYYRFVWDRERDSRALVKCENGQFTILAEDFVPYIIGQSYKVKIVAQGSSLQVSIDGSSVFSVNDSTFSSGTIALYSWGNEGAYFDDILVEDLSIEAYTITTIAGPGGSISPSRAVSVNQGDNITFTMTPDNGYIVSNIHTAGNSQGAALSYTYYHVNADSTLRVYFMPEANLIAETIYVDNTLALDCLAGEYSVANRDNSGTDGSAYNSILEAANAAGPGDTVLIRAGTYNSSIGNGILWPKHSGTPQNPIVFKPYNSEQVIIGDGVGTFPNDNMQSIARGAISMRNVSHIEIEG
ncbi:MAG: hypothetical protein GY774_20020, partial [Planctomycetes bacterium]|nr:hypothetical protein [Planctomycetota bacterium]